MHYILAPRHQGKMFPWTPTSLLKSTRMKSLVKMCVLLFVIFIAYSLKDSISSFTQLNSGDLVPISNITIGIVHCPESGCPVPSNVTHVDYVLYDGPYTPTASGRGYYHNFYYLPQVSSFSNGNGDYLLYLKSRTTTSIDSDSSDVSGSHISDCV